MKHLPFLVLLLVVEVFAWGPVKNDFDPALAITVSVSPANVRMDEGTTRVLVATVTNDPNHRGVTWTISAPCDFGPWCRGAILSQSSTTATYRAPLHPVGTAPQVRIIATSRADSTKSARANVSVVP
jgi:hypothetical protein